MTVRGRLAAGVLTGALAGSLTLAVPASAAPVDTTGTVVRVVDGDTVIARIKGKKHPVRIRITGLNAMELTDYRPGHRDGECHARQAARRMEELVLNKRVKITARNSGSESGKRHRLRRSLEVKKEGKWIDPAAELMKEGLALWLPNKVEYLPNATYPVLAARAAREGRGLWDTDSCGAGPSQNAVLRVTVKWRGDESVSIDNLGAKPVSLAKWWLRDSSYLGDRARGYEFPSSAVVPAGGTIVLHVGKGKNGDDHYYWKPKKRKKDDRVLDKKNDRIFDNVTGAPEHMADGAYLFDPDGDLRAAHQYAPHAPIQFP
ncbi:lamin tail domain-containing protein [Micromonospora sp. NPDC023956]|uniref:lamin tail domain-containing protein n=1 Tax=Micromonospora sp. NPDC023956 TaxID=3155722 RepID=UPI003407B31D